jgi:riboflavin kinase/FMN adenylyltransferase
VVPDQKIQIRLLTSLDEKKMILEEMDLDCFLVLPFTKSFSGISPDQFIQDLLVSRVGVTQLIVGYNHGFGRGRKGDTELLKQLSDIHEFNLHVLEPYSKDGIRLSSTRIRDLLSQGNVRQAADLLGRHYMISGKVVKGKHFGRELGFPTANLEIDNANKLIPPDGVYAAYVRIKNKKLKGTVNIGTCPTVKSASRDVEVHIHNFSGDIYGEKIIIEFYERIRDESCFDSIESLRKQIGEDIDTSQGILENH